jgi:hypothetical protein
LGATAGAIFAVAICVFLLFLLGVIVRFSIISSARTKGWQKRLRRPEISEVEAKWGVKLPQAMGTFFRSEIVERSDFYLAPSGSKQSDWWYIERFVPLTRRDLSEWMKVTNAPGIPFAIDASKGTYYIPFEPLRQNSTAPVLLRLPGRKREDRTVSSSFEDFAKFEPREAPDEK